MDIPMPGKIARHFKRVAEYLWAENFQAAKEAHLKSDLLNYVMGKEN